MQTTIRNNGKKYTTTISRGTEYTAVRSDFGWTVYTRRLNYGGRFHVGGVKTFPSFQALQQSCKAFASVELADAL